MSKVTAHLRHCIETMEDACKLAMRHLDDEDYSDNHNIAHVLHALSWGWANASTGIEAAIAQSQSDLETERYIQLQKDK